MTFGEKIKNERLSRGLDQSEFAKLIGVSVHSLSDYETGKTLPRTREYYKKIAAALGCTPDYLISDSEEFILGAAENYGSRGRREAEKLLEEVSGLFAGGEMAEEDMDELMLAIQQAYIEAKKRNKKYTPKKYLNK